MTIKWIGANANNFEVGRKVTTDRIVLHWIVGKLSAADAEFQKASRQASAHYGVGNKVVHQYVKEEDTAYHCGNLAFNRRSIGIEHEGGPDIPITDETYATSAELVATICKKYAIPLARTHIVGHREVSATQCPGVLDIDRIIRQAKTLAVSPVESPELIACKAQVAQEIKNKEETYQELVETRQDRDGALEQVKALQEQYKGLGELLGTTSDPVDIRGKVAVLIAQEDNIRVLTKQLADAKQSYIDLEQTIEPMAKEKVELRNKNKELEKENTDLKRDLTSCQTSQSLTIIGKVFGLYICKLGK